MYAALSRGTYAVPKPRIDTTGCDAWTKMGAGVCGGGACAETPTPSSQHHVVYTYRKPSKVSSCGEIGAEGVGFLFLDAGYDWSIKEWLTICLGTPKKPEMNKLNQK